MTTEETADEMPGDSVESEVQLDSPPSTVAEVDSTPPPPLFFMTQVKQQITPYLPPPVVQAMKTIDPALESVLGPEPSIMLLATLLLALVVRQVVSWLGASSSSGAGAIQEDPEDDEDRILGGTAEIPYEKTVIFCGPPQSGKTSLFYTLLSSSSAPSKSSSPPGLVPTVSTLRPNTAFANPPASASSPDDAPIWRYLDTPGHWGASKLVSTLLTNDKQQDDSHTWILVLDSTQPVGKAADYLHALLSSPFFSESKKLLVACHKSKASKAKNVRRLKLQLRQELERLEQMKDLAKVDWEARLQDQVVFAATSIDPLQVDEMTKYLNA